MSKEFQVFCNTDPLLSLFKEFQINITQLLGMKTKEEKETYILKCMDSSIHKDFKRLSTKQSKI